MKIGKFVVFILLLLTSFNCCRDDDDEKEKPARTVLVYMVASNLGDNLDTNIADMIYSATAKNLRGGNLVVFYSQNQTSAELFEIKEGRGGVVTRHHLRDYENQSAISPDVMRMVINEVVGLYPNDSYGLILSSHGTSWLPANDYNSLLRSFGEENGKKMEIYDLAAGLPDGLFDFLIFDACSMASVECVYELRHKANYIVASPSETMTYGIPYKTVLPCLFTEKANLDKVIEFFYQFYEYEYSDNYGNRYPYGNISITQTSELENLASITKEIISGAGDRIIYSAPLPDWQVMSQWRYSPTKLYDFGDVIHRIATPEQSARFTSSMAKVVTGTRYTENHYCSEGGVIVPVEHFSGLSVYPLQEQLPRLNEWYKRLEWYKAVYE
jgi:hypothetical protein